ncbi:hypothetical protein [Rhizobium sp. BK379]|jgi:hypothetical protein|uniref:hypothetical protein n=1 Tax=Rhizobium sp. BK379 TaxID=2587059 RepID=UPI0018586495|nr:hypothetical protein [Rhizobium sp. BK379]MBB3441533.1 hypothetical protein [Rhizobium sp. BK379]
MFDEIIMRMAPRETDSSTTNGKPLPLMDLIYAPAVLKARPAKVRKRIGKRRMAKLDL